MDLITAIDPIRREIAPTTRDGEPARRLIAERSYPTSADDLWDALTNAERIPRWFLPVSGDLRLGGRFQLEGNAGGTITTCDPPRHLGITWEYGGMVSWVDVHLTPDGDATALRLEHVATIGGDDKWDEYGPGAVGIGWDLTLAGLAQHVETKGTVNSDVADPAALDAMRRSSDEWCQASIAFGTPADVAEAAAARTTAAYTGG
jgi:uncharacterized protein YndB with AHSA1/START domain